MLIRGLQELRDEYEVLGDVRGTGLMLGIELVKDKVSNGSSKHIYIIIYS